MDVNILHNGIEELKRDRRVAEDLGDIAEQKAAHVDAPSDFSVSTRHGVSARGAFAQVIMTGANAIPVEFGSIRTPALAPLRRAIRTE
jgi:hypothetical protein